MPRDLYLELYDRSEILHAPRQQCCRSACQISKWWDNSNYLSRGFESSRDLTIRRLIGYWNRSLAANEFALWDGVWNITALTFGPCLSRRWLDDIQVGSLEDHQSYTALCQQCAKKYWKCSFCYRNGNLFSTSVFWKIDNRQDTVLHSRYT